MTAKTVLRLALITSMALFSSKAWSDELRDAPFWANLQSLNTLVPEHLADRELGVIFVDVPTPLFSWFLWPKKRKNHAVLWFKVTHETHLYGGLFLTVLDTGGTPFFFPVDPAISLPCIDIDEVVRSVNVLEPIDSFIRSFCTQ
jgi:hypothetical protein